MEITYTTTLSSLGTALVACTEKGVCAILLGDDESALAEELHKRFAKATIVKSDEEMTTVQAVVDLIERPHSDFALPLDAYGTAFQQQVWNALQQIPPGRTLSYSELAQAIGKPTAMRAVAGACAANPIAIAIPCHRVVRNDGAISGYRWGVSRKRELLSREKSSQPC